MTQTKDNKWPPDLTGGWVLIEIQDYDKENAPQIGGKIVSVGPEAQYRINGRWKNRCKVGDYVLCNRNGGHHLHALKKTFVCIEDYKIIKSKEIIVKKNSVKKTKIAPAKKPQPLFYIPKAKYDWLERYGKETESGSVSEVINGIIEDFQTRVTKGYNNTSIGSQVPSVSTEAWAWREGPYPGRADECVYGKTPNTMVGFDNLKEDHQPKLSLFGKISAFFKR